MVSSIFRDSQIHTHRLNKIITTIQSISSNRFIFLILLLLSVVRNIILILAYPPARGADSILYYLFAERLNGLNIPVVGEIAYPLYPIFILVSYNWLGSLYILIGVQFIMSSFIAPIYYSLLKSYSSSLALLASLIIIGDMQLGIMFNFVSTEPPYIFLMALLLYIYLKNADNILHLSIPGSISSGVLLCLLLLTRSVGRYLIVPFALLMFVRTRRIRESLMLVVGFVLTIVVYSIVIGSRLGSIEGLQAGNYMVGTVLFERPEWVSPANGAASVQWLAVRDVCPRNIQFLACIQTQLGSWDAGSNLMQAAAFETMRAEPLRYVGEVIQQTQEFLALLAFSYGVDEGSPATLQCYDLGAKLAAMSDEELLVSTHSQATGLQSSGNFSQFRPRLESFLKALCPAPEHSESLKNMVDDLSFRYRSLGRPQPFIWYGLLFVLVVAIPWARRYWMLVAALSTVLFNHALASALIFNVQPRYVAIINPMRAILLSTLLYIIMKLGILVLDRLIMSWRKT
jgi:hypothetical protein